MLALFDLIHTLTKEEKRLYHLHGKGGRLVAIYDAYQKAGVYTKQIDQTVYKDSFADVTRAFYSMQKRALLDDILFVLLEYSNNAHPSYQFLRSFTKGMILLQRQLGNEALDQLREASEVAHLHNYKHRERVALWFQTEALMLSEKPTFASYAAVNQQLDEVSEELHHRMQARRILQALQLLYDNHDDQALADRRRQAQQYRTTLDSFDITQMGPEHHTTIIKVLKSRLLLAEICGTMAEHHKELLGYWEKYASKLDNSILLRWQVLNLMLKSALKSGDFLNLSGAIYKTNRLLSDLSREVKEVFLPDYLETSSLYNFYEKDLTLALEQTKQLIGQKEISNELLERAVFYRLAMLIAAHLPQQAKEELESYQKRLPGLANDPKLWVIRTILALESHAEGGEILLMVERIKIQLRKLKNIRQYQDNLYLIEALIERKKVRLTEVMLFPPQWEQILRIDLLLLAKKQNNFYYNLLCSNWEKRKQVFAT
ncbi:MAG: hypothetical protein KF690_07865 [Bacteroidetes bacterium]|nr:hypothetical protein [Bacteroidota bacterium]